MQREGTQMTQVFLALSILYALAVSVLMSAQNQFVGIQGTLMTPAGRGACARCSIQLEDATGKNMRSTLSDPLGNFYFNDLQVGIYTLRVQATEFNDTTQVVTVNTETTRVFIELETRDVNRNDAGAGHVIDRSMFLDSYPKLAVELFEKASTRSRNQEGIEALRLFEEAIAIAPNFYAAHTELGITYESLGMLGEAQKEFQVAGRINLSSPDPMIHLGGVHILRNEWGPATEVSVEAIRRDPQEPRGYFHLGIALYCISAQDLAESALQTTLNLNPKMDEARLVLADIFVQSRKWNDALQQLDRYLQSSSSGELKNRVSALRAQLRRGERPPELRIAVPIRVGRTIKSDVCARP